VDGADKRRAPHAVGLTGPRQSGFYARQAVNTSRLGSVKTQWSGDGL